MSRLKHILTDYKRVLVAYSGGVDSTFLLRVCLDILGRQNVFAVTAVSETYTIDEMNRARQMCHDLKVIHDIVETDEMTDEYFVSNGVDRCYHCKRHFYSALSKIAAEKDIIHICDGSNTDDKNDRRPGRLAAMEYDIKSPLLLAGLTKTEIRRYSRALGLATWDKPANPCLASRIPYGERITREKLVIVEQAERFIREMGFTIVRVRHHDRIARIEVPSEDIPKLFAGDCLTHISKQLKGLGFTWIVVDMDGYRQGSMNEIISGTPGIK